MSASTSWLRKAVVGFGRFWWDFLVGDTPELFIAVVAILVLISVLSVAGHASSVAVVALPILVTGALALSVRRAAKNRS